MPICKWSNAFSVNIQSIDEQHQGLFNLTNALHEARLEGKGREVLGTVLEELIAYAQSHFATEEALMMRYRYPDYTEHKTVHDNFVQTVLEFRGKFTENSGYMTLEVITFLRDWLVEHIQGMDQYYGPFLVRNGVR